MGTLFIAKAAAAIICYDLGSNLLHLLSCLLKTEGIPIQITVKSRVSSYGKIHGPGIGILYIPSHLDPVLDYLIGDKQLKGKGVLLPALLTIPKKKDQFILCLLLKDKIHISGKAMLSHLIGLPLKH